MQRNIIKLVFALTVFMFSASAWAEGRLVVYCSNKAFACQAVADAFSAKYDVKVQMTRAGSGSTYAKILAEKANPKGDVWYAGTLDPHSQAHLQDQQVGDVCDCAELTPDGPGSFVEKLDHRGEPTAANLRAGLPAKRRPGRDVGLGFGGRRVRHDLRHVDGCSACDRCRELHLRCRARSPHP